MGHPQMQRVVVVACFLLLCATGAVVSDPVLKLPAITVQCGEQTEALFTELKTVDGIPADTPLSYTDIQVAGCGRTQNITRQWKIADAADGAVVAEQTMVVVDTLPPVIQGPSSVTAVCGERMWLGIRGFASATDLCDPAPRLVSEDGAETGTCVRHFTRFWTATDACGNIARWEQQVVRNVTKPPRLDKPPANVTVACGQVTPTAAVLSAVDACDGQPLNITVHDETLPSDDANVTHIVKRTWIAVDQCLNTATASQFIHYTCLPEIVVPPTEDVKTQAEELESGEARRIDALIASDGTVPLWNTLDVDSKRKLLRFSGGKIQQTLFVAPADTVLDCAEPTDPRFTGEPLFTSQCDPDVVYTDEVSVDAETSKLALNRNWTLTDACGNSLWQLQVIYMHDTIAPALHLPPDIQIEAPQSADPINTGRAIALDSCDFQPTVTFDDEVQQGVCEDNRVILRRWSARDSCGNTATAVQRIDVRDTSPPILTAPESTVVELNHLRPTDLPTTNDRLASICLYMARPEVQGIAVAKDRCDPNPFVERDTSTELFLKTGTCNVTRIWHARDRCGNAAVPIEQIIVIRDTIPPVLTVPADVVLSHGDKTDPSSTKYATATDNGYVPDVTFTDEISYGSNRNEKHIVRSWTATDASGNTAKGYQNIVVQDPVAQGVALPARELCLWPADGEFHCFNDIETTNSLVPVRSTFTNVTRQLLSCISSDAPKHDTADCIYANGRLCLVASCASAQQDRIYTLRFKVSANDVAPASYIRKVRAACSCVDCEKRCLTPNNDRPPTSGQHFWKQAAAALTSETGPVLTTKPAATSQMGGADTLVIKTLVVGLLGLAAAIVFVRLRSPQKAAKRRGSSH